MSLVLRGLLGLVFASLALTAWADSGETVPAEPVVAEEPAPEPEPVPEAPVEEAAPAPEPEAEAPAEEAGNQFYAGIGLGLVEHDIDSDSATVTAANLRAGYFVLPWLAVEAQILSGLGEADLDRAANTEVDLGTSYGIYLKPHFNFGPLDLFATLGYANISADVNGPGSSVEVGDTGPSYGFGTRIPTAAGAFDLEYLNLFDEDEVTIEALMFSYNRFF